MKLMKFIDKKNVRTPQSGLSYSVMYDKLWMFMERDSGSIAKLREIFRDKKIGDKTLETLLLGPGTLEEIRNKLGWTASTKNSLFDKLFDVFSHCKIITGVKPTESTFLTVRTSTKANNMYRFKLNWLILIAFHIYHTTKPETQQQQLLIDICEFVENLYKIFVGWMMDMGPESLRNEFMPKTTIGEIYIMKTNKLITAESTDSSLERLREAIRDKLCEIGPNKQRISAAKAAKETAKAETAKAQQLSSPTSSRSASPESLSSGNTKPPVREAWGPETQVPQPPPTTSPLIRRIKGLNPKTPTEQDAAEADAAADAEAVAEEARKKFAAEDAAVAAKRPSRGNVVAYDAWKKTQQDHPGYEKLAADAAAANEERLRTSNAKLGPVIGPSDESIKTGKDAAFIRKVKQPDTKRTGGGGNNQRTRKRQRISSTHHHTKRRLSSNSKPANHKHTRKARQVRASVSV
jgi:hypothetical protein